jgi:hypothetical protein
VTRFRGDFECGTEPEKPTPSAFFGWPIRAFAISIIIYANTNLPLFLFSYNSIKTVLEDRIQRFIN